MDDIDNWKGNSPLPLLYAKTATGTTNTWLCWVEGPDVCVRWGLEEGQQQEARFRCVPKNVGRVNATTAEEQARFEAIAKWKKQCKKKYNQTRELSFLLKPMLAVHTTYDPIIPADSVRLYADQVQRAGSSANFVQQYVKADGHCHFSGAETAAALDELILWKHTGKRPDPGILPVPRKWPPLAY